MCVMKTMSEQEIEVGVGSAKFRYKRLKAPSILKPCEHYVSERGLTKKRLLTFHGMPNGMGKMNQYDL